MGFIIDRLSHTFQESIEKLSEDFANGSGLGSLIILCLRIFLLPLVYVQ